MAGDQRPDSKLSGIEYHGVAGSTQDCEDAVLRLLQCGVGIRHARIVTSGSSHCLLLTNDIGDEIAIKSGFASGYGGAGPTAFSRVLQLLYHHGAELDEWTTDDSLISRLDQSALTVSDLEAIEAGPPLRPNRWSDYIDEGDYERATNGSLWRDFPPIIPFSIIDPRIMDLARDFWSDADGRLNRGYRRLEDAVRARTGFAESGAKLFSLRLS